MGRIMRVTVTLVGLVGLLAFPGGIAANGSIHLTGNGQNGTGSQRFGSANVDLSCLGVSADYGDIAEVTVSSKPWVNHLVVDGAGHAHIRLIVRDFTFAVYPAPGADLPNPGDPGYLFTGSVAAATIETNLSSLTPDEFGDVTTMVSIPITMHNGDGTVNVDIAFDVLIVIIVDSSGAPSFITSVPVGGRCP
jgi:hypothetical protein